jgi:hypothetical protein
MTLTDQDVPVIAWNEPDGLIARGTVIVIPGRGELPTVYERFGRRLAGDDYRVRAVADPVADAELARAQISGLLGGGAQRQDHVPNPPRAAHCLGRAPGRAV